MVAVGALVVPGVAAAQAAPQENPLLLNRPHTVAVLEAGIIDLPTAPISPSNRGGSTPLGALGSGDATVQTGVHLLFRASGAWAIGAFGLFAPLPTSDTNFGGASQLHRTHARSYLTLGGEGRYFPLRSRWFEGWLGLNAGGVILADRFTTDAGADVPSLLGTKTVNVGTEGFAIGLGAGADYLITDQLVIGFSLRADRWFLPSQKPFSQESSCDPIGDCPTLTGSVAAFELGVTLGYRIPL